MFDHFPQLGKPLNEKSGDIVSVMAVTSLPSGFMVKTSEMAGNPAVEGNPVSRGDQVGLVSCPPNSVKR